MNSICCNANSNPPIKRSKHDHIIFKATLTGERENKINGTIHDKHPWQSPAQFPSLCATPVYLTSSGRHLLKLLLCQPELSQLQWLSFPHSIPLGLFDFPRCEQLTRPGRMPFHWAVSRPMWKIGLMNAGSLFIFYLLKLNQLHGVKKFFSMILSVAFFCIFVIQSLL